MWSLKGIAYNIEKPIIGRFTTREASVLDLFSEAKIRSVTSSSSMYKTLVGISSRKITAGKKAIVANVETEKLDEINDGDILRVMPEGEIQKIWDSKSKSNVLFLTSRCNSRCIMCPQPVECSEGYIEEALKVVSMLKADEVNELCVTGGEPTLMQDKFLEVLAECKKKFSDKSMIVLTNGRNFKNFEFVRDTIKNAPRYITFAIPLYAPYAELHDEIVGVKGAFRETIKGLYNLVRFNAAIEIRVVITKKNYKLLPELANYIGWNLPMVSHIALMGMETHGMADENIDEVWIEPLEFNGLLKEAVKILDYRNLRVSVYNLPLCLLNQNIWKYSRQSISEWKQEYIDSCKMCVKKKGCAGFFSTSSRIPNGISAIK